MEPSTQSLLLPPQRSTFAPQVDALFHALSLTSVVCFVAITLVMLVLLVRYRRVPGVVHAPSATHHGLELFWTFSPLLLLAAMFHYGVTTYTQMAMAPDDALVIRVRARQWAWEFEHPNGLVEDNELHVPAGRPVRLAMSSSDVIHSLFIPDFRVKRDVVPGMFSSLWFEAVDPGGVPHDAPPRGDRVLFTAQMYCAEYCGANGLWGRNAGHATMYGLVHVMRPEDYAQVGTCTLTTSREDASPEERGAQLFATKTCSSCHGRAPGAPSTAAPNLFGVAGTEQLLVGGTTVLADEAYLRRSILEPRVEVVRGYSPIMPQIRLTEAELNALIAYLQSLRPETSASTPAE